MSGNDKARLAMPAKPALKAMSANHFRRCQTSRTKSNPTSVCSRDRGIRLLTTSVFSCRMGPGDVRRKDQRFRRLDNVGRRLWRGSRVSAKDNVDWLKEDPKVEGRRCVLHVVQVVLQLLDLLFDVVCVSIPHLCPTRQTGANHRSQR